MRRLAQSLRGIAFLILIGLVGAAAMAAPPDTAAPTLNVTPIQYSSRTLENGLRVFAIPDRSTSNVSVQVWYNVGGKDDPRGKSGFAHLFEHLMFKATRNLAPEQIDRLTEDVGGFANAFTRADYTQYYEVVPANHLQRLLWVEAERMGALVIDPAVLAAERDVVKEERRSGYVTAPYGPMYLYFPRISYDVHPYARPTVGSNEDLDAATIEDVRAFHATYYRPDNAVLIVSGNFDQGQLDEWIDQYFGPIKKPGFKIPRVMAVEPERTKARSFTVYEPNTPLPAVLLSYQMPPAKNEDSVVFEVIDAILATGENSRLYQSLVYRGRIASDVESFPELRQETGMFILYAILANGVSEQAGEQGLRNEIAKLREELVSEAELAEAKNELLIAALRQRETVEGKATLLGSAVILYEDPEAAHRRLARIAAVTAQDVQRVARTWFTENRSALLRYLPEAMRPAGAKGDTIEPAATVQTAVLTAPAGLPVTRQAPQAERIPPPPVGPEIVAATPRLVTQRLDSGLTVVSVARTDIPLVTATLAVGGGAATDPVDKPGLSSLVATLVTKGTAARSATQIAQAAETLGASLASTADWDGWLLSLTVKSDQANPALALMADVAQNAAFAEEEFERARALAVDAANLNMKDPALLARTAAAKLLYGRSSYGGPMGGTPQSLQTITRADAASAFKRAWLPANATLILTGDVDAAQARRLAEQHFGAWKSAKAPVVKVPAESVFPRPAIVVIDMPEAGQAAMAVLKPAVRRADPDFYRVSVANAILGGSYSARLNQEIRIKRGLAYSANSSIDPRRGKGPFVATTQTKNPTAPEALALILAEMNAIGGGLRTIGPDELAARRSVLIGGLGRRLETTTGLAELISGYILEGVGPDELGRHRSALVDVTVEQARNAARHLFDPSDATVVIVGNASLFADRLREKWGTVTVISFSELNLGSPNLR
jgi:zinc protease